MSVSYDSLVEPIQLFSGSVAGYQTTMTHALDGSPGGNYHMILKPYRSTISEGVQLLGTKYVSLHPDAFPFIKPQHKLPPQELFWSNTKKVHHRDVLHHMVANQALYLIKFEDVEQEYNMLDHILDEMQVLHNSNTGEVCRVTDSLGAVLSNAQGMQLTNTTNIQNPNDYGHHSKLQNIEIDSGITKDQIKTGFVPSEEQTDRAVQMFLESIKGCEYNTSTIHIPKPLPSSIRYQVANNKYKGPHIKQVNRMLRRTQ